MHSDSLTVWSGCPCGDIINRNIVGLICKNCGSIGIIRYCFNGQSACIKVNLMRCVNAVGIATVGTCADNSAGCGAAIQPFATFNTDGGPLYGFNHQICSGYKGHRCIGFDRIGGSLCADSNRAIRIQIVNTLHWIIRQSLPKAVSISVLRFHNKIATIMIQACTACGGVNTYGIAVCGAYFYRKRYVKCALVTADRQISRAVLAEGNNVTIGLNDNRRGIFDSGSRFEVLGYRRIDNIQIRMTNRKDRIGCTQRKTVHIKADTGDASLFFGADNNRFVKDNIACVTHYVLKTVQTNNGSIGLVSTGVSNGKSRIDCILDDMVVRNHFRVLKIIRIICAVLINGSNILVCNIVRIESIVLCGNEIGRINFARGILPPIGNKGIKFAHLIGRQLGINHRLCVLVYRLGQIGVNLERPFVLRKSSVRGESNV